MTQTDLLEALAGEIKDDDELDVVRREDGSFLVDATMAIQDAFEQLGIAKVPDDQGEYRTLAGFILRRLGHIPTVGERFEWGTEGEVRRFEVVDLDGHRIDKVIVSRTTTQPDTPSTVAETQPFRLQALNAPSQSGPNTATIATFSRTARV